MHSLKTIATAIMFATLASVAVDAQTTSRNVAYHSQDIVAIHAKVCEPRSNARRSAKRLTRSAKRYLTFRPNLLPPNADRFP
jgi:hypothetical protein